jgi:hypothetical protein
MYNERMMPLWLHILIHLLLSIVAGVIGWSIFKRKHILNWCITVGIIGGVLIDSDHLFDHFMAYGLHFDPRGFISGTHFIINNKIYVPLHGYEYVLILLGIILFFHNKTLSSHSHKTIRASQTLSIRLVPILISLTLAMLFHLIFDVYVNDMPWQSYSILYRISHNFDAQALNKPENYLRYYNQ